jgi:hypothetical protein
MLTNGFEHVRRTVRTQTFEIMQRISKKSFLVRQNFISAFTTSYFVGETELKSTGPNSFTIENIPEGYINGAFLESNDRLSLTFDQDIESGQEIKIQRKYRASLYEGRGEWNATWISNYVEAP